MPMNPYDFSISCRCIRHGPDTLMAGRGGQDPGGGHSNFIMTLCRTLHIRFERPQTVALPIRRMWASEQMRTTFLLPLWQV